MLIFYICLWSGQKSNKQRAKSKERKAISKERKARSKKQG